MDYRGELVRPATPLAISDGPPVTTATSPWTRPMTPPLSGALTRSL
jgi:hypothetical protein